MSNLFQSICTKIQPQQTHCKMTSSRFQCFWWVRWTNWRCFLFPANPVVPEVVDAIPTHIPEKDNKNTVQPNQQSMSQDDKTFHTHKKQSRLKKCYSMTVTKKCTHQIQKGPLQKLERSSNIYFGLFWRYVWWWWLYSMQMLLVINFFD